jgi:hypothetical protein
MPASRADDRFGISIERRAEFAAEVIRRCRAAVGDFPIIIRIAVEVGGLCGESCEDAGGRRRSRDPAGPRGGCQGEAGRFSELRDYDAKSLQVYY